MTEQQSPFPAKRPRRTGTRRPGLGVLGGAHLAPLHTPLATMHADLIRSMWWPNRALTDRSAWITPAVDRLKPQVTSTWITPKFAPWRVELPALQTPLQMWSRSLLPSHTFFSRQVMASSLAGQLRDRMLQDLWGIRPGAFPVRRRRQGLCTAARHAMTSLDQGDMGPMERFAIKVIGSLQVSEDQVQAIALALHELDEQGALAELEELDLRDQLRADERRHNFRLEGEHWIGGRTITSLGALEEWELPVVPVPSPEEDFLRARSAEHNPHLCAILDRLQPLERAVVQAKADNGGFWHEAGHLVGVDRKEAERIRVKVRRLTAKISSSSLSGTTR
ncbi:hypothetical protein [Nocardiopsis flavescens]